MQLKPVLTFVLMIVVAVLIVSDALPFAPPAFLGWVLGVAGSFLLLHEFLGKPIPFLRLSVWRMGLGLKSVMTKGQVGDGREQAVVEFVERNARRGDVDDVINAIDRYARKHKFLMNVGDQKGRLLDAAVDRAAPIHALEVGAYIGYSALRIARRLPDGGHLISVEFSAANGALTRRILEYAGVSDRVTVVVGAIGDGGETLERLRQTLRGGGLELVFLDHDKDAYLADLRTMLEAGLLRQGCIVVADNVGFLGAPEYRAYLWAGEGDLWETVEHETYLEYQSVIPDSVLESKLLRV